MGPKGDVARRTNSQKKLTWYQLLVGISFRSEGKVTKGALFKTMEATDRTSDELKYDCQLYSDNTKVLWGRKIRPPLGMVGLKGGGKNYHLQGGCKARGGRKEVGSYEKINNWAVRKRLDTGRKRCSGAIEKGLQE